MWVAPRHDPSFSLHSCRFRLYPPGSCVGEWRAIGWMDVDRVPAMRQVGRQFEHDFGTKVHANEKLFGMFSVQSFDL
jgi:hypothetical protein